MDEKDLKILVTIDESDSLSQVAEKLYVTQPALTYRLQQIEKSMNAKLFNRGRLGIHPTVEGELVISEARKILHQFEVLRSQLAQLQDRVKGVIRIGVASTFGQYLLPTLLKEFLQQFPHVKTEITTDLSRNLTKSLNNGEIHLAIVREAEEWEGGKLLVCQEPLYIASKEALDFANLPQEPAIEYKMDRYLKEIITHWWRLHFANPPNILMEVDRFETGKAMANLGLGYAILPGICFLNSAGDTLIREPLRTKNGELITRTTWLLYRKTALNYPTVNAFIAFMHQYRHQIESLLH